MKKTPVKNEKKPVAICSGLSLFRGMLLLLLLMYPTMAVTTLTKNVRSLDLQGSGQWD